MFFYSLSRIYTESSPADLVVVNCLVVVNLVATNLIWGDATAIASPLTPDYLGDAISLPNYLGMPSPRIPLHYTIGFTPEPRWELSPRHPYGLALPRSPWYPLPANPGYATSDVFYLLFIKINEIFSV
jgi:hypothetical protein